MDTSVEREEEGVDVVHSFMSTGSIPSIKQPGGFVRLKQNILWESSRLALSSQVWRNVVPTPNCDLLITLAPKHVYAKNIVTWLVETIRKKEPRLKIEVRYHALVHSYGLYFSATYHSLLRGVEILHLKKRVKDVYGGGLREFVYEDLDMFAGVENKARFLTSEERGSIVRYFIENIRADENNKTLDIEGRVLYTFRNGQAIVTTLLSCGILQNMLMLHETVMKKRLQKSWVQSPLNFQPLQDITCYFGVQLGLYFAWLGHYTTSLFLPATLGFIIFWCGDNSSSDHVNTSLATDICFVVFAFFNCIWGTLYIESWKRKQAEYAYKWGTLGLEKDLLTEPRPMFQGPIEKSEVTGHPEPVYPNWKRNLTRYGFSLPVTLFGMGVMFCLMLAIFELQEFCNEHFEESYLFYWIPILPKILLAVVITVSDEIYVKIGVYLNDLENYRTDEDYENNLIFKILSFQFVNSFLALFYIAFYLKDMQRLKIQLAAFLITKQVMGNLAEAAIPFFKEKLKFMKISYEMTKSMSDNSLKIHAENIKSSESDLPVPETEDLSPISENSPEGMQEESGLRFRKMSSICDEKGGAVSKRGNRLPLPEFKPTGPRITQAELESLLPVYESPLEDYLEMVIQFGYVLLFSPAFPLAALCALINNLLEIRVDAFKLCYAYQRPFGRRVEDIGNWMYALELMGVLGVVVNCALIGQSGLVHRLYPNLSFAGHILLVVILEHLMLAMKVVLSYAIPDVPHWVTVQMAKIEYARRGALKRESRRERCSLDWDGGKGSLEDLQMEKKSYSFSTRNNRARSETPLSRVAMFDDYESTSVTSV